MGKKLKVSLLALVVAVCMMAQNVAFAADTAADKDLEYLRSVMEMIKEKYKGNVTDKQLVEGALKGMFDTMDPYTVYWTPEEAESFLSDMEGAFGGIGISMEQVGEYVVVTKVFPASPAEKAGLAMGDKIVQANGKSLVKASLEEAVSIIRGEVGTKVTLGVIKAGKTEVAKLELTREIIKINPVAYSINNDIGYVRIDTFNANTAASLDEALKVIDQNNISKLVLDLRNNPGGLVDQAVAVARKFVRAGLITKLDYKSEMYFKDEEYYSSLVEPKYKLVVLVNQNSASASEILAGAIQDTKSGVLIGTKTFGKAKVQITIPLLTREAFQKYEKQVGTKVVDAYQLIYKHGIMPLKNEITGTAKITVGEYTTPLGRMIDKSGILPEYLYENPEELIQADIPGYNKLTKDIGTDYPTEGIDVYNAEKILKLAGYEVDAPDTTLDEKTAAAISKFQSDSGLISYGTLDYATQSALNSKLEEIILKKDIVYARAIELLNN